MQPHEYTHVCTFIFVYILQVHRRIYVFNVVQRPISSVRSVSIVVSSIRISGARDKRPCRYRLGFPHGVSCASRLRARALIRLERCWGAGVLVWCDTRWRGVGALGCWAGERVGSWESQGFAVLLFGLPRTRYSWATAEGRLRLWPLHRRL